jgi:NAD(P)-dependent dehydrogenase (short-subunit alcohol dehydrogenase family)
MPMLAAQLAVPMMINSGGNITNVSSSGGMGSRAYVVTTVHMPTGALRVSRPA